MQPDPEEIHRRFIEIDGGLNPELVQAFQKIGPVQFQPDDSLPLVNRLCRSVAGQQLSVIAARTIWQRVLEVPDGKEVYWKS